MQHDAPLSRAVDAPRGRRGAFAARRQGGLEAFVSPARAAHRPHRRRRPLRSLRVHPPQALVVGQGGCDRRRGARDSAEYRAGGGLRDDECAVAGRVSGAKSGRALSARCVGARRTPPDESHAAHLADFRHAHVLASQAAGAVLFARGALAVAHHTAHPNRETPTDGDRLGSPRPAFLGDVEDDPVWVLELELEIDLVLRLAELEEECAAGGLDAGPHGLEVLDLEAEMVRADEILCVLEARAGLALVAEQREIDHAVAQIDARADFKVVAADALQVEDLLVERGGFLDVAYHDRKMTQLRHRITLAF